MKKVGIKSTINLLWKITSKKGKALFFALLILSLIRSVAELLIPVVTACIVAKFSGQTTSIFFIVFPQSLTSTELIFIAFALLFTFRILGTAVRTIIQLYSTKMMTYVNETALEFVLESRKNFKLNMTNGEASYIIKNAGEQTAVLIDAFLVKILVPVITTLITMIYIGTLNIFALLILITTIIILGLIIFYRTSKDKKTYKQLETTNGEINNHIINNLENLPFIGFFKSKQLELNKMKQLDATYYSHEKRRMRTYITYWCLVFITEFICSFLVCFMVVSKIKSNAEISSLLIVLIPYLMNVFLAVENLAFVFGNVQQYCIKISRLFLLEAPTEDIIKERKSLDFPIEKITVKNLKFEEESFSKIYKDIDFYKGKINVVSGSSGSGKTTLMNCLLGLKEYSSGEIIINDQVKVDSLFYDSDKISISFQGENLFDRSVVENIMYPKNELNERATQLIKLFELENIINREQHDKTIKNALSGGEKKRITFIRCLQKDADVYILDEPTNELDESNVKKIIEQLELLKTKAIVIIISHDKKILSISENIIKI